MRCPPYSGKAFLLLCSVLCFHAALYSKGFVQEDTSVVYQFKQSASTVPWNRGEGQSLFLSKASVIHGEQGITLRLKRFEPRPWENRIEFKKDFWLRFCFRLDTLIYNPSLNSQKTGFSWNDISLRFFESIQKEQIDRLVTFQFKHDFANKKTFFICRTSPVSDPAGHFVQSYPIDQGKIYCVETHVAVFKPESLEIQSFVNGAEIGHLRFGYLYPQDAVILKIAPFFQADDSSRVRSDEIKAVTSLDDFKISDNRPYISPFPVSRCTTIVDTGNRVFLRYQAYHSPYADDVIKKVRWRIFKAGDTAFSELDLIDNEVSLFSERWLPYAFDRGDYQWQVRLLNHFEQWGDWSVPNKFSVVHARPHRVIIDSVYITEAKRSNRMNEIERGNWAALEIKLHRTISWDSLTYLLVWLNNSDESSGHLMNKGGVFNSSSNYVFNLNLWKWNGKVGFFEKSSEKSASLTKFIGANESGVYTNGPFDPLIIDTSKGLIRFGIRTLENARPGHWRLSACLNHAGSLDAQKNLTEDYSNIFRIPIDVVSGRTGSRVKFLPFFLGAGIIFVLVLAFYLVRRKSGAIQDGALPPLKDENLERVMDDIKTYIRNNMKNKITPKIVRNDLKLSKALFYSTMAFKNETFINLANQIRVDEAKKILVQTDRNISKAAFEVGFYDANYFCKIFKKHTGMSPTDYLAKTTSNRP